jgi:DNA-binding MarR family transcriptional regulator
MSETRWLDAEEQRAWRAYLDALHLLHDRLEAALQRDAGLSHADYEIFVILSEAPGRQLRMSELAERALFSRSRLSHAVARMERAGWVVRSSCPDDRRGTFATLTDAGYEKLRDAAAGHVDAVRAYVLDRLSREEFLELGRLSETLARHLKDAPASA